MLFLFLLRYDAISGEITLLKVIDIYLQHLGDKFVDTLSSKGVTLENKTIHTRPLSPTFKVEESGVVSYRRSSYSSTPLNGGEGREIPQ